MGNGTGFTVDLDELQQHAVRMGRFGPQIGEAKEATDQISGLEWHLSYGLMCQFFAVSLIPVNNLLSNLISKVGAAYDRSATLLNETATSYSGADVANEVRLQQILNTLPSNVFGNQLVDPKSRVRPEDYMSPGKNGKLSALNPLTSGHDGNWTSGLRTVNDVHLLYRNVADQGKQNLGVMVATITSFGIGSYNFATDPIGTLAGMGAGWAIDHVKPLKTLLDALAGNPTMIKGAARSWDNIATHLGGTGDQYAAEVTRGTSAWHGNAADAYRNKTARNLLDVTKSTGYLAKAMSVIVATTGEIVSHVRTFVRDLLASLVADLVKSALKRIIPISPPTEDLNRISRAIQMAKTVVDKLVDSFKGAKAIVSQLLDMTKTVSRIVPLLNGV